MWKHYIVNSIIKDYKLKNKYKNRKRQKCGNKKCIDWKINIKIEKGKSVVIKSALIVDI